MIYYISYPYELSNRASINEAYTALDRMLSKFYGRGSCICINALYSLSPDELLVNKAITTYANQLIKSCDKIISIIQKGFVEFDGNVAALEASIAFINNKPIIPIKYDFSQANPI